MAAFSGDPTPIRQPPAIDEESILRWVKGMMGAPKRRIEIDDETLSSFLEMSLEEYSRHIPDLRWFSMPAFAGVQAYRPKPHQIGNGVVDVMVPRIDPIAPLLMSSGPRLDIFSYRYCFAGDTSVSLLDGRERTILEVIEEYGDGPFWVYSVDEEGEVKPGLAHSARKTGEQEEVVRVTIDNGESVVVTPAHKFILRDGTERPAGELKPGDSLMPLYREWHAMGGDERYKYERARAGGGWKYTHRLSADFANHGVCILCGKSLPDPEHSVRHHINFNKRDNRPENFRWVTAAEHEDIHSHLGKLWDDPAFRAKVTELSRERMQSRWADDDGRMREDFSERAKKQWENPEYRARKIAEITARHASDPKFRKIRDAAASATLKKLWASQEFVERKATQQSAMMKGKWADEEWRSTSGQVILAAFEEARKDPAFQKANSERLAVMNSEKWENDPSFRAHMSRQAQAHMMRLWADPEFRLRARVRASARLAALWEDPEFRERHRERLIARWEDPAYRAQHVAAVTDSATRNWVDDELRAKMQAGIERSWTGEEGSARREAVSSKAKERWADPEFKRKTAEKMVVGRARGYHRKKEHEGEFEACGVCQARVQERLAAKSAKDEPVNHKVVSVEPAGFADVYNFMVEGYHKFGLTCEIFTCQSYPYRDIMELYTDQYYFTEAQKVLSSAFAWKWMEGHIFIHPKPDEPFPLTFNSAFPRSLESMPFSDIDWIKKYTLAQTEVSVGRVRSKFTVPGQQTGQVMDGAQLVEAGMARMERLEADLIRRAPPLPPFRTS